MIKKINSNNKIFHLVVGFLNCNYFKNSLDSLISNNIKQNILLFVTGYQKKTEKKDRKFVNAYLKHLKNKGIKFVFKEFTSIQNKSKTGNLYLAYNYALNFCYKKKIKYLNIIQNDMQMIFWDNDLENILNEMFLLKKDAVFFHTGFIRIGSHPFFFKENKYEIIKNLFYHDKYSKMYKLKNAIGDWGLYNIEKLKKINFKFKQNETFIGNSLKKYNYNGYLLPYPFISVLPWPSFVRKNTIFGRTLELEEMYFKKFSKQDFYKLARSRANYFQEDIILANNWWYLFPPIYTDLNIREYIKQIINIKFHLKRNILFYYNGTNKINFLNFFKYKNIKPNLYELAEIYFLKIIKKFFSN